MFLVGSGGGGGTACKTDCLEDLNSRERVMVLGDLNAKVEVHIHSIVGI